MLLCLCVIGEHFHGMTSSHKETLARDIGEYKQKLTKEK